MGSPPAVEDADKAGMLNWEEPEGAGWDRGEYTRERREERVAGGQR